MPSIFNLEVLVTEDDRCNSPQYEIRDVDGHSSRSSCETENRVKNINVLSQAWTKWSLISAHVG